MCIVVLCNYSTTVFATVEYLTSESHQNLSMVNTNAIVQKIFTNRDVLFSVSTKKHLGFKVGRCSL